MRETLIIIPTQKEMDLFLKAGAEQGLEAQHTKIGRLPVVQFPELGLTTAQGGLGKVQFAVQTQHLLDVHPNWDIVICAGAAGALVDELSVGDVVVATETVEHDINNSFSERLLPRYRGARSFVDDLRGVTMPTDAFAVRFGPVASGDEDVAGAERREEIRAMTGALAVAWEGAGGARACRFSSFPFVEIRTVTDGANSSAASDYAVNLRGAMSNVMALLVTWLRN
jgi:adenosylhomocysteine nucleosidase